MQAVERNIRHWFVSSVLFKRLILERIGFYTGIFAPFLSGPRLNTRIVIETGPFTYPHARFSAVVLIYKSRTNIEQRIENGDKGSEIRRAYMSTKIKNFTDLETWKSAHHLVLFDL